MVDRAAQLRGDPGRHRKEATIRRILLGSAVASILVSAAIVLSLIGEAITFVRAVELGQLWEIGWFPRRGLYDIRTIVVGTLLISAVAMVVATPLGLGAAIYLSEYANRRVRKFVKPTLEVLAGIPSIVLGFFALTWISPEIVQRIWPRAAIFNMAAAGIGVGILVTPLVASISEDALRSVPGTLREAAYGLGAHKRTSTVRVVFPAAISGIVASLIVGISRAIGETMVVFIAAGATGGSLLQWNITQPGQTMTAAMAALAIGSDRVRGAGATFQSLFFVGLLLFFITLLLNILSNRLVRRVRERY